MDESEQIESPEIVEARAGFEKLRSRLNAIRIAYANNAPFEGHAVDYEDLKQAAKEVIQANYDLQTLRYGKIRLKLSVSKLLRRGW